MMAWGEHPFLTAVRVARMLAAWSTPGDALAAADAHLQSFANALAVNNTELALQHLRNAAVHVPHLSPVAATIALSLKVTEGAT
jgi:hypothetical protein